MPRTFRDDQTLLSVTDDRADFIDSSTGRLRVGEDEVIAQHLLSAMTLAELTSSRPNVAALFRTDAYHCLRGVLSQMTRIWVIVLLGTSLADVIAHLLRSVASVPLVSLR